MIRSRVADGDAFLEEVTRNARLQVATAQDFNDQRGILFQVEAELLPELNRAFFSRLDGKNDPPLSVDDQPDLIHGYPGSASHLHGDLHLAALGLQGIAGSVGGVDLEVDDWPVADKGFAFF